MSDFVLIMRRPLEQTAVLLEFAFLEMISNLNGFRQNRFLYQSDMLIFEFSKGLRNYIFSKLQYVSRKC